MEILGGLLVGAIYVVAVLHQMGLAPWQLWLSRKESEWFDTGLFTAGRESGIRFKRRRSRRAVGERGDYVVHVELKFRSEQASEQGYEELLVTLTCDRIPQRLSFSAERNPGLDLLTGDNVFDDAVEIHGEATVLAALLDESLRLKIRRLVAWDGRLEAGRLSWRARAAFSAGEIPRALGDVIELADLLTAARGGICERLARNAREDPQPGVRLWNLALLQQHFGGTQESEEASRAGLADASGWVRLAAARALRDEGIAVLDALVQDRKAPEHAAAEAVALLAARLPVERAGPLLVSVLKSRSGEVRRQAIEELGRMKFGPAFGPLLVLLERSDPRTAAAAAAALGALGDARAEAELIQAAQGEARELRLAAARALGALGNVRSVEPLLEILGGRVLDAESRQALRDAVFAIQSRLAGAEAGQISLAANAPESGRLSLAARSAGHGDVSLADRRRADPGARSRTAPTGEPESR